MVFFVIALVICPYTFLAETMFPVLTPRRASFISFTILLSLFLLHWFLKETSSKITLCETTSGEEDTTREQYLHTLKIALTGSLYPSAGRCKGKACITFHPYDSRLRERGNDWPPVGYTMIGHLRMDNIKWILEDVVRNNVPGDFIELGVWKGGSCMFARAVLDSLGESRRDVVLFDKFGKIKGYGEKTNFLSVRKEDVQNTFDLLGLLKNDNVKFVEGMFADTLPNYAKALKKEHWISVLRIDGNFYSSYQDAMYFLYDRVPLGGYVIFDDILSTSSVQQFWEDFKRDQGLVEDLVHIDDHSTWFKKSKQITTNWDHYKNEQTA